MLTVVPRFLKTPRCHACCEKKEQQSRQRPQRCRCRDLDLLKSRRSRAFLAAPAPRQALAQAGCRVSRVAASVVSSMARLLRVSDRLPTGSFGASKNTVIVTLPRDSSNRVAFLTRRSTAQTVGHFLLPGTVLRTGSRALNPARSPSLFSDWRRLGVANERRARSALSE